MMLSCIMSLPALGQVIGDQYNSGSSFVVSGELSLYGVQVIDATSTSNDTRSSYKTDVINGNTGDNGWKSGGNEHTQRIAFHVTNQISNQAKCLEIYHGSHEGRGGNSITVYTTNNRPDVDGSSRNWTKLDEIENSGSRQINYVEFNNLDDYLIVEFSCNDQVQITEIKFYSKAEDINYGATSIKHKPAKWYDLADDVNTERDDFDETGMTNPKMLPVTELGASVEIQNAHTLVDTIYVTRGDTVRLIIPDWLQGTANNWSYQRWYDYDTGGTFATGNTGNNQVVDLLTPVRSGLSGMPPNGEGYRFANGYIGDPLSSSGRLYAMDFYYPAPTDNFYHNKKFFRVACDVSGYTDFTENFDKNATYNKSQFVSGGYWEPTLGHRFVFYIIPLDDDVTVPVDAKSITMPATRIPNLTEEMVALSRDARAYALRGQKPSDVKLTVSKEGDCINLITNSLNGQNRVIHFSYNATPNGDGTVSVTDGSKASIIVKNGSTEVARFNLTFDEDYRLLSQSQVKELNDNKFSGTDKSNWHRLAFRTPQSLNENYEFLTELNFDYDPDVPIDLEYGTSKLKMYPFPLAWTSSTYGFYYGGKADHFIGSHAEYPEWGYYSLLSSYIECDGWGNARGIPQPDMTRVERYNRQGEGSAYHLFADVSDRPGVVARLPFDRDLCRGTELFVTAWVKCARGETKANNAGILFTVMGVSEENDKTTYTPIYRYQTGQIPTTYYNDEHVDLPGFNKNEKDVPKGDNVSDSDIKSYIGDSENEWFQAYFSFINSAYQRFDSYVLQIDNNSASTNGGDLYVDDVRIYIATVNPRVTQLDANCADEPVRINVDFNFERLLSRTGEKEETTATDQEGDIVFCILNKDVYDSHLADNPNDEVGAINAAAMAMGVSADEGGTGNTNPYLVMHYNLNFAENALYEAGTNNALAIQNGDKWYFRRNDRLGNSRSLTADICANVEANRTYYIVMANPDGDIDDSNWATYFTGLDDVCAIKSERRITPRNMLRINGEIADPSTDYCVGQTFNFTAEVRVPDPSGAVDEDGHKKYIPLDEEVYFDWFFGDVPDYILTGNDYNVSLDEALMQFREVYPEADAVDESTPATGAFTKDMYDLLLYYSTEAETAVGGQHPHPLVLRQRTLNITLLEGGLKLIARPIQITIENIPGYDQSELAGLVCWDYVPLELITSSNAPQVKPGFNTVNYPKEYGNLDPNLRIGLRQIESVQVRNEGGRSLVVDLRDCKFSGVDQRVDRLGTINGFDHLYLVSTDDPNYTHYFGDGGDFNEYSLPAGNVVSLEAHPYEQAGTSLVNEMKLQFDLNTTQDNGFKFEPKEGYTYNFAVHFEEKTSQGQTSTACSGRLILPIKVVPEYVKWTGDASKNWNNDTNWKRLASKEVEKASYSPDEYFIDGTNPHTDGFVPMLFTKVLMPANSNVWIYKAGYSDGGNESSWNTERPGEITQDATSNIQYDLMAYGNERGYGHETDELTNITTQRYRVNICDQIHFEPGAEMLRAEYLLYNRAWTDVEVPKDEWSLVSTPLRDVYSGDWYTQTTGKQETEYFKNITFTNKYNRLQPAVFQRSWNDGAIIVENDGGGNTPVSFSPLWSAVYNDASVKYDYGIGYSVNPTKVNEDKALFRFPKDDLSYNVATTTLDRTNEGKLAASQLVERNTDYNSATEKESFTVALTPVEDNGSNYYIIGNPFTSSLDLAKFFETNEDVLQQKYWKIDAGGAVGPVVGVADEAGNWISTDWGYLAPYQAMFVQKNSVATSDVVTFTADMEVLTPKDGNAVQAVATPAMMVKAQSNAGKSSAALAFSGTADNGFVETEDAQLMTDIVGNGGNAPYVYTVAGDMATSINRIKDVRQVPLGVFAAEGDVIALTFTGVDALLDPTLYDAELNTETPITEGMTLSVDGASHGRYFIRSRGAGDGTTGITDVTAGDDGVSVYSVVQGQVVVSAGAELREVRVYSVGGALLKSEGIDGGRTAVTISGVDSGVAIVRVTTADGAATRKITVK